MATRFRGSSQLKREINGWVDDEIITRAQAEKLFQRYELEGEPPWYMQSGFILKALGLLLGGMGLLLIISENWHRFSIPVRMSIGLIPLFIAYFMGIRYWRGGKTDNAELAFFIAGIAFGANIALQAQIFHISAYFPNGILWWMIGLVPVALFFRSRLHAHLIQLLFAIWIVQQIEHSQFSLWGPLILASLLYLLYIKPGRLMLLATIYIGCAFLLNVSQMTDERYFFQSIFWVGSTYLLLNALKVIQHQYQESFITLLRRAGVIVIGLFFFLHTFEDYIQNGILEDFPVMATIVLIAGLALFLRYPKTHTSYIATLLTLTMYLIQLSVIGFGTKNETFVFLLFILSNLVFVGSALAAMYFGLTREKKRYFMTGVFMIILMAIFRYLVLFDDYVTTAMLFMSSGLFLFAVNYFWNRRYEKN